MSSDLDDLLGGGAPAKRLSPDTERRLAEHRARLVIPASVGMQKQREFDPEDDTALHEVLDAGDMPDAVVFTRPVSITFMAKVLGVETRRLHNKLSKCPVVGYGSVGRGKGAPLYDFKVAIAYCVEPKVDIGQWIKSQSSTSLPPMINKVFWEAERVKMRVMEESKELWHTESVLRVFGNAAMTIKDAMTLWVERLPGAEEMSSAQYDSFRKQVALLQAEIHRIMVEDPQSGKVESYRADIEALEDGQNDAVVDDL